MANFKVVIDPSNSGRLIFSKPVTLKQAIAHLWSHPPSSGALRRDPLERSLNNRQRQFLINKNNHDIIFSLQHGLVYQYMQRLQPIVSKGKATIPGWVPVDVKNMILKGQLEEGVIVFPGKKPFGKVVVWTQMRSVRKYQIYQEYPNDYEYYLKIAKNNSYRARLLHKVYTEFNSDMSYFVVKRGMSPEYARNEIHRINDECFKLILWGVASMMSAGASITSITSSMTKSAPLVFSAAMRRRPKRPWAYVSQSAVKVRPVNGKVNVGGGTETPNMTNLNPCKSGSGGPTSGIPNHVRGSMEQMDELIELGSVKNMISVRLRFVDVNWSHAANAAAKVMQRGGKVKMNIWCQANESKIVKTAFENAGFRDVNISGSGVATMLTAVR